MVAYWARNLDDLLIGRFGSAAGLGFYSRAYMLMLLPVQQVVMVIGRVLFPAFSRLQHDHQRLREAYVRAQALMLMIAAPISFGLAAAAGPFIDVAYGTRWHPAAELLTILALSGPAQRSPVFPVRCTKLWAPPRRCSRRGLFNAAVTVIAIVVGLHWGTTGVAVALLIKYYGLFLPTVAASWRVIRVVAHGRAALGGVAGRCRRGDGAGDGRDRAGVVVGERAAATAGRGPRRRDGPLRCNPHR